MRIDADGEIWKEVLAGAVVNVVSSYIAAKVTGQEFGWRDAGMAAFTGALAGAKRSMVGGIISGVYTAYTCYKNGATTEASIVSGVISGVGTMASVGNIAEVSGTNLNLGTAIATDATFGTGYNIASTASTKSITEKNQRARYKPVIIRPTKITGAFGRFIISISKYVKNLFKWR